MAIASANAAAKSIGTKILPAASGLRPIASIAFEPIQPMLNAGTITPMAIARALAHITFSIILLNYRELRNLFFCHSQLDPTLKQSMKISTILECGVDWESSKSLITPGFPICLRVSEQPQIAIPSS